MGEPAAESRVPRTMRSSRRLIKAIHDKARRTYGSPRVHEELKAQGHTHGEKRVARIMQEEGLRAKTPRRFRVTTDSNHAHPIAPERARSAVRGGRRSGARPRVDRATSRI